MSFVTSLGYKSRIFSEKHLGGKPLALFIFCSVYNPRYITLQMGVKIVTIVGEGNLAISIRIIVPLT